MSSDPAAAPTVLAFHKLTASLTYGSTNYSPRRFEALLMRFRDAGLLAETAGEEAGERIRFTFDDGYAHLIRVLPEFIERFGIDVTIFVPTSWIGRTNDWDYSHLLRPERHLNAAEIQQLSAMGAQFGSHGHSHNDLTRLSDDRLRDELSRSKAILEDVTGNSIVSLSYPFGRISDRVISRAIDAGYTIGYSMRPPTTNDMPLAQGRVAVYGFDTAATISQKVSNSGLSKLWHGLARSATALSSGTVIFQKLGLLKTDERQS